MNNILQIIMLILLSVILTFLVLIYLNVIGTLGYVSDLESLVEDEVIEYLDNKEILIDQFN